MTLSLIEVVMAPDAPDEFCEFRIGADAPLPATCLVVIERPGQDKPFLAADGWQSNYVQLATPVRQDPLAASCLRLSGTLLRFFETGYNYRIILFDPNGTELGLFVVNWYPPPRVLSPVAPPRRPSTVAPDTTIDVLQATPADYDDEPLETSAAVAKPHPDHAARNPPLRNVTRCGHCGGEVFSIFATCPFCGHGLR